MQDLLQTPILIMAALLAAAYMLGRHRDSNRFAGKTAPRRRFSRPPQRRTLEPRRNLRAHRDNVIDQHHKNAIFLITENPSIDGYELTPLGEVRVDEGAGYVTRLKRAAAQRFSSANALVLMQEVREMQQYRSGTGHNGNPIFKTRKAHEWRTVAVQARPKDPDMAPPPRYRSDMVLVDGSNLIHWDVDAGLAQRPSLRALQQVLADLKAKGVAAGVVFDATAGHELEGRFMGHAALAARLPSAADVLVVERGTQADWVLIQMAREEGAVIISNDHLRDAPQARHLLKQKGYSGPDGITLLDPRA